MHWQDDYLDYPYPALPSEDERVRLLAYVDGRLVDSWTESVHHSRWQRFADQFDHERRPRVVNPPDPPRHEQVLRWLDGLVGGREALLALTDAPVQPVPPAAVHEAAYAGVREALDRVSGDYLDVDACRVLDRSLALLWEAAPHAVTGASSVSTVAGGLLWIVAKANGLFDGGFTQQLVRRELWLKQQLHLPGKALARHLRGLDFHAQPRPHGCPDLTSFARVELLTSQTRRTLVEWRDLGLALSTAEVLPPEVES